MNSVPTILQIGLIDEIGDSRYRVRWPGEALARQNPSWRIVTIPTTAEERFVFAKEADLLVLCNSEDVDLIPIVDARRARSLPTVVEYNDNFYEPPPWASVAAKWRIPPYWATCERFMELADAVTVSSPALKTLFGQVVPEEKIFVLENHLPSPPPPFSDLMTKKSRAVSIGWGGSQGHMADLLSVAPILGSLVKENPTLEIHLMGHESIPKFMRLPEKRLVFRGWGTMSEYYEFLQMVQIGIIPFLNTPFNIGRSDVKAVEMSAYGMVPVLPKSAPYLEFIRATGLTPYEDHAELKQILTRYICEPEAVRSDAKRCHEYVSSERIFSTRRERTELYARTIRESSSTYGWTFSTGYHEYPGTPKASPSELGVIRAKDLVHKRTYDEALDLLTKERARNRFAVEIAYFEIQLLASLGRPEAKERIVECRRDFPKDFRFDLFSAFTAESAEVVGTWVEIVARLKLMPTSCARFYLDTIVELLPKQLQTHPELIAIGEEIIRMFPGAAGLQFVIAETCERFGLFPRALVHFEALLEDKAHYDESNHFLAHCERYYLEVWCSTLRARLLTDAS